jgi:hypothetical protein
MSGNQSGGDIFFEADVSGIDALIAKFDALPERIVQQLRKDLSLDMRVMMEHMARVAPKRSGRLAASFTSELDVYPDAVEIYFANNAPYARIQDQGGRTRPHRIQARNAKALFFLSAKPNMATPLGGRVFADYVNHPGGTIRPKEFMLKGLLAAKAQFLATVENAVATSLTEEFRS